VAVRAHRQGKREQHIVAVAGRGIEAEQRRNEVGAFGRQGPLGVDNLHLFALEHRDVGEFAVGIGAAVLDHQQAGLDHLDHKAERRDRPRGAPHRQLSAAFPNAEMNAGPFDGRRELREVCGVERQRPFHEERGAGGVRGEVGQRDCRLAAFFTAQARPKGGVDDAFYRGGVGGGHLARDARELHVAPEMLCDGLGDGVSRRVGETLHAWEVTPRPSGRVK